jgi:hypothetical protein
VHCCAPHVPVALLRKAGAGAISLDATLLTPRDDDGLGEAVESGAGLLLGVVPASDGPLHDLTGMLSPVQALWRRLGQSPDALSRTVVITPTCGLAGSSPGHARRALQTCVEIARRMGEAPE